MCLRPQLSGDNGTDDHSSVSVGDRPVVLITAAEAPLLAQPYFAGGDPGAIVAALAQVPEMLEVAVPFITVVLGPSAVDLRTKVRTFAPGELPPTRPTRRTVALISASRSNRATRVATRISPALATRFGSSKTTSTRSRLRDVAGTPTRPRCSPSSPGGGHASFLSGQGSERRLDLAVSSLRLKQRAGATGGGHQPGGGRRISPQMEVQIGGQHGR